MQQTAPRNAPSTAPRLPLFAHDTWAGGAGPDATEWKNAERDAWPHWWLYVETSHAINGDQDAIDAVAERHFLNTPVNPEDLWRLNQRAFSDLSSVYWTHCVQAVPVKERRAVTLAHGADDLDQIIARIMIETIPTFDPLRATSFILYMRGVIYPTRLPRQEEFLSAGISRRDRARAKIVAIAIGELQARSHALTAANVHAHISQHMSWPPDLGRLSVDTVGDILIHLANERPRSLEDFTEMDVAGTERAAEHEYETGAADGSWRDMLDEIESITSAEHVALVSAWTEWEFTKSEDAWDDLVQVATSAPFNVPKTDKRTIRRRVEEAKREIADAASDSRGCQPPESLHRPILTPVFSDPGVVKPTVAA